KRRISIVSQPTREHGSTCTNLISETQRRKLKGEILKPSDITLLETILNTSVEPAALNFVPIIIIGDTGVGKTELANGMDASSNRIVEFSNQHGAFYSVTDSEIISPIKMAQWTRHGVKASVILVINAQWLSDRAGRGTEIITSLNRLAACINWEIAGDSDDHLNHIRIVFTHLQKPRNRGSWTVDEIRSKLAQFQTGESQGVSLLSTILSEKPDVIVALNHNESWDWTPDIESGAIPLFSYRIVDEPARSRVKTLKAALQNLRHALLPPTERKTAAPALKVDVLAAKIRQFETDREPLILEERSVAKTWPETILQLLNCGLVWKSPNRIINFPVAVTNPTLEIVEGHRNPIHELLIGHPYPLTPIPGNSTQFACRPSWSSISVRPIGQALKKDHPDFRTDYMETVRQFEAQKESERSEKKQDADPTIELIDTLLSRLPKDR
ncbi:hypothetical protein EBR96_03860, partial [bacterium]|nr:hypothetical protein [bacterium]